MASYPEIPGLGLSSDDVPIPHIEPEETNIPFVSRRGQNMKSALLMNESVKTNRAIWASSH